MRIRLFSSSRRAASSNFLTFEESCEYIRPLGFSRLADFSDWCAQGSRPAFIPSNPNRVYCGQGWTSFPHWFGYGTEKDELHARRKNRKPRPHLVSAQERKCAFLAQNWTSHRALRRPPKNEAFVQLTLGGLGETLVSKFWPKIGHHIAPPRRPPKNGAFVQLTLGGLGETLVSKFWSKIGHHVGSSGDPRKVELLSSLHWGD